MAARFKNEPYTTELIVSKEMNSRNVADVEIEVRIISESGSGIKVTDDDETTVWLPKSQIKIDRSEINNLATIILPEWLAIQKGLV